MTAPTSFRFISQGFPPDTFQVISFVGEEALSQPYEFNINLATAQPFVDLDRVLEYPATFVINQGGQELPYHGVVVNIDQVNRFKEYTFYQVVLAPRLYWLGMTRHNQVFLDKTIPEVLAEVLQDGGLTSQDFEFRLQGDESLYRVHEMVCQYNQSHLDFFSFWAESMGLYYYFEQGRHQEKVVVTDTHLAHRPFTVEPDSNRKGAYAPSPDRPPDPSTEEGAMLYATPSGLEHDHMQEVIFHFRHRQRKVQRSVRMKDYNYQKPSVDLTVETGVVPHGVGQVNIHDDLVHYNSAEEGQRLARIRAEELRCRETICTGLSRNARLRTGHIFHLNGHYQENFNRGYMTIQISHSGNQKNYLTGGLKKAVGDLRGGPINILTMTLKRIFLAREESPVYENRFITIPADVQFRPERKTGPSQILGVISAVIDGSESGKYAALDSQGRYKVILPFDSSGRKDLKASAWIRLAQPTGGGKQGLHFPLRPGTEVLLTFLGGDPNRPVIVGAVPNPENPNIVTSANFTRAAIQSAGGNQIVMDDTEGQPFISLCTGDGKCFMSLGTTGAASNSATGGSTAQGSGSSSGGAALSSLDEIIHQDTTFDDRALDWLRAAPGIFLSSIVGDSWKATWGTSNSVFGGARTDVTLGAKTGITVAAATDLFVGLKSSIEAALSNRFGLAGSSDFNLGTKVSCGYGRSKTVYRNHEITAAKDIKLAGGAEDASALTLWTTIGASLGSLLATAAGLGVTLSGSVIANSASQGGFMAKNPSVANVGAEILGVIGEIGSLLGLTVAEAALLAVLLIEKKTKKTATLELNSDGMKVTVQPPSELASFPPIIDMACSNASNTEHSTITMDAGSTILNCYNNTTNANAAIRMETDSLKLETKDTVGAKSTITIDNGEINLTIGNYCICVANNYIRLFQKGATPANLIEISNNCVELTNGVSSIELDGVNIRLDFASLSDQAGTIRLDRSGNIQLG